MHGFLSAIILVSLSLSAQTRRFEVAPVPADPHELVVGMAQVPATPAERAAALDLLERARQNADLQIAGTPPFILTAQFTASGNVQFTGDGELSETWINGRNWRWTARLGDYTQARVSQNGRIFDEQPVSVIPMRVQMLRAAIFNPVHAVPAGTGIRTAAVQSNGKQVTCLLSTERGGQLPAGNSRSWEEREYCVENDSGLLLVYSEAPGVYAVYGYGQHIEFHGRTIPDQITVYMAGVPVIDARISMTDAGPSAESIKAERPAPGGHPVMLGRATRFTDIETRAGMETIQTAIVHVTIDRHGSLLEEELVTAPDRALGQTALQIVKDSKFSPVESTQREAYINVRFSPAGE